MGRRYAGILTDGAEWICYHLGAEGLKQVTSFVVHHERPEVEPLLVWLEGVLATTQHIQPRPSEIALRLGAESSSYALDRASLSALYARHKGVPSVKMKRQLWARLLTTALGTHFEDKDDLFVEHTLLVSSAEIIAHAVVGFPLDSIHPASLVSGEKFRERGIYGVVESDFFDWVVDVPGGDAFVRTLARRLGRFDWTQVEHDVLKVLYESIITPDTRRRLGEYYTPDWLASQVVATVVREPLTDRVLDPACGSGTFLFHAVRSYLQAAEAAGMAPDAALMGLTAHVIGMDLHPVAVTLARVTYLLAIGRSRLAAPRGEVQIPVFLGDSMQWQQDRLELFTGGHLVIRADEEFELFQSSLRFPDELLADARSFDELVEEMALKASSRRPGSPIPALNSLLARLGIPNAAHATISDTFQTMCRLHDQGRDHIWGYYVRNLARPLWLSRPDNQVDVLVGNPPWLAYRHMPGPLQQQFREMSQFRGLWKGAKVATHQDLSALFVTRVVQLYLRAGGRFGLLMPNTVVDLGQFEGFRKGDFPDQTEPVHIAFDRPWDLRKVRPHFFPRPCAVVFGRRAKRPVSMSGSVEAWSGKIPPGASSWDEVEAHIERTKSHLEGAGEVAQSEYHSRFRQGASIVPRVLFMVKREHPVGTAGVTEGRALVRSAQSANEKKPWKDIERLKGVLETEFVRPVYVGPSILPYRTLIPEEAVLPVDSKGLLTEARLGLCKNLEHWWGKVSDKWLSHRSSDRFSLVQQLDFHGKLSSQFPLQPVRIVYSKSGMHLCCAVVRDRRAIIDHTLYWATASSAEEASYLCGVLNSAVVTELVRPLMSHSKDERHIDKHVWRLPIPVFDAEVELHSRIAALAKSVEAGVAALDLDLSRNNVALRRDVRTHLAADETAQKLEKLVTRLLAPPVSARRKSRS